MAEIEIAQASHDNVVMEIGIASIDESSNASTSTNISRETRITPPRDGNSILPLSLIQALNEASITEEGSTSQENLPFIINTFGTHLSPIEEVDEIN